MDIGVIIEQDVGADVDAARLRSVAESALLAEGVSPAAELGIVVVGGDRIAALNREYLGRDGLTDVIAFHMRGGEASFPAPPDGVEHLGEVVICYPQAEAQAHEQGHSIDRELNLLVIHGVLHLLGYEDEEPEAKSRMHARQDELLRLVEGGKK